MIGEIYKKQNQVNELIKKNLWEQNRQSIKSDK